MSLQLEDLRWWSQILFWLTVIFPVFTIIAGIAKFYVDKTEKKHVLAEAQAGRKRIEDTQNFLIPRTLSTEQVNGISDELKRITPHQTACLYGSNNETSNFASDIQNCFSMAKWNVRITGGATNTESGIRIYTADPDLRRKLVSIFSKYINFETVSEYLEFPSEIGRSHEEGMVYVLIGNKRLSGNIEIIQ